MSSSDATAKLIRACMATAVLVGLLLVVWFVLGTSSPAWAATGPSHPVGARVDPATTSGAAGSTLSPSGRRAGHLRHRPMRAAQTAPVVADARAVLAVAAGRAEPAKPVKPPQLAEPAGSTRSVQSDALGPPAFPANPLLGPVPNALLDQASPDRCRVDQPTELAATAGRGVDPPCNDPGKGTLRPDEPAGGDVFGDRGQDVASFPARTQHPLASPSDHDPQRPSSTPSSHGPGPLLPRGSSGPGTGPGRTGSTGNGGSSFHSFHSIDLAVLVRTCVLRSPREIRASFDSATFRHGSFLPSRLERPG